uniref:Uncharacterized protein n=1 Tax=Anguilla anguilla TaxID=7936 RepID=A0A0E9VQR7_ANGAN
MSSWQYWQFNTTLGENSSTHIIKKKYREYMMFKVHLRWFQSQ